MRFSYKFDRAVAAGGTTTLGTDAVPTDSTYLANDNVFKTKLSASEPSQRICLAAKYTGAGVPVPMTATAYIYDGVSGSWFTVDSYKSTLKCGDISFFGIPQIISPTQVSGGDEYVSTIDSVEWALVVDLPAGCPDGTFEFLLGLDISEVEDEIQAGHVEHVIVDSPNPMPVEGATAEGSVPAVAANPLDLGAVVLDADPVAATDTKVGRMRLDSLRRLIVRAYTWSFTKGGSTAAGVTSTPHGADHQALDTTPYGATAVGSVPAAAVKPMDMGAVIQDADPAAGTDTQMGRMRLDSVFRLITRSYQWTSAKGAALAAALTSKPVSPDVQALDMWDSAPTHATYNYSTARTDASAAVRASDTTLTWSGPTLTTGQLCRVRVITTTTARPLVWEQGRNAVITISGATITVNALDGTVATIPAAATTIEVMWSAQDKGFDAPTNAHRNVPMYSDRDARVTTPIDLIAAAQTLTTSWADLGAAFEVNTDGYTTIRLWLQITKQQSDGIRIRALLKHTSQDTLEYWPIIAVPVATGTPAYYDARPEYVQFTASELAATDYPTIEFKLNSTAPFVQFQVMMMTDGGTDGTIDSAKVTYAY